MLQFDHCNYRITWSEEDKEYVGQCAEFSSFSWLDQTPEEALKGIRQLVADLVPDPINNGENVPEPLATKNTTENFRLG
jgi:predicted RNase H-like HicB family nuclease